MSVNRDPSFGNVSDTLIPASGATALGSVMMFLTSKLSHYFRMKYWNHGNNKPALGLAGAGLV
jgi:hypothetical protein